MRDVKHEGGAKHLKFLGLLSFKKPEPGKGYLMCVHWSKKGTDRSVTFQELLIRSLSQTITTKHLLAKKATAANGLGWFDMFLRFDNGIAFVRLKFIFNK